MPDTRFILFILLIIFGTAPVNGQLSILSVHPAQNSIIASEVDSIRITFSSAIDVHSFADGDITIYGNQTGLYTWAHRFDPVQNTLFIKSYEPFKPGELISVTVSDRLRSAGGQSLPAGYQWQFTVRVEFGTGRFYDPEVISLQPNSQPVSIYVGDLNRDYYPDLATVNFETGLVTILGNRGHRDDEFRGFWIVNEIETGEPGENFSTEYSIQSTSVDPVGRGSHITGGDITGDGNIDLIVCSPLYEKIILLKNTGSGTFEFESMELETEYKPLASVLADFNNNGLLDIAVVTMGDNRVVVHYNTGGGNFSAPYPLSVGRTPLSIVARDINNSGFVDILVTSAGDDRIDILLNRGDGTFSLEKSIDLPFTPALLNANVLIGNDNGTYGDGNVDIVVSSRFSNQIAILKNTSDSKYFEVEFVHEIGNRTISGLAVADIDTLDIVARQINLDKDYDLDIITSYSLSDQFFILENRANQSFGNFTEIDEISSPVGIAAADFDLDGDIDLAVTNIASGTITLLYNAGGREMCCGAYSVIDFGDVCINTTASNTLPVENNGPYDLYVTITYTNGVFSIDSQSFVLSPGDSKDVIVYFNPDEIGIFETALLISWSIDEGVSSISSVIVPVRGRGVNGSLSASPIALDFGDVIAEQSVTQSFILHNSGNINADIVSMETSTDNFTVTTESFSTVLPVQPQTVTVEFNPPVEGIYEDKLVIMYNDLCSVMPDTLYIDLHGRGLSFLPDLIADNIEVDSTPILLNQTHTVTGYITNKYKDVDTSFRSVITLRGEIIGDTTITGISADEVIQFPIEVQFGVVGRQEIKLIVDYDDDIDELTTQNNEISSFVTVERGTEIFVRPNPFTPNNDGFNDRAGINYAQIGINNPILKIYSIDGRLLRINTEPEGYTLYWDGFDKNGKSQLPGVYLFVLEDGNEVVATGTITLAR